MGEYFTYMVLCSDRTLYTGYTDDLKRRMEVHNRGKGAKYTKARLPVKLVYWQKHATKQAAMQHEYAIKQLSRAQKLKLLPEELQMELNNT